MSLPTFAPYGFITWLTPFALSFLLMGKDAQPIVSQGMFKSLMIIFGEIGLRYLVIPIMAVAMDALSIPAHGR